MTDQDNTKSPMTPRQHEEVAGLVTERAEGMVDQGIHDDLDEAMEFAPEMVSADIKTAPDLEQWARDVGVDPDVGALDRDVVADGTKFDDYDAYTEWCREHHGTE